jgi:glutamyl-tRNA synthetase
MIEWFDVTDINKGAARFDFQKLEAINGLYMRASDDKALFDALIAVLPEIEGGKELEASLDEKGRAQLLTAMPGLKDRAKTLVELADGAKFIFAKRPLAFDEKAASLLNDEGREVLKAVLPHLESVSDWTVDALDAAVRAHAETVGLKLGKVAQPLRAALTGRATSPGVFDVLFVLGREESLARIKDQIV